MGGALEVEAGAGVLVEGAAAEQENRTAEVAAEVGAAAAAVERLTFRCFLRVEFGGVLLSIQLYQKT